MLQFNIDAACSGGINACLVHHLLREGLTPLELCRSRGRPEARDAQGPHRVSRSCDKGNLRADHDEVNNALSCEIGDGLCVSSVEIACFDVAGDAGITGSANQAPDSFVRPQSRDESMLPSTGTDDEDVHIASLTS